MNHRDLAGFSSAEFLKAYAGVFKKLVDDPDLFAERQPRAFLLGGQSGAGKTNLHKLLTDELGKNAIVINGDEYRSRHPRFAKRSSPSMLPLISASFVKLSFSL